MGKFQNTIFLELKYPDHVPFYGTTFGNAIATDDSDNVFITGGISSIIPIPLAIETQPFYIIKR